MNTANQVVVDAVAKLNAGRADQVQVEAIGLIKQIEAEQTKISNLNKSIEELRLEANKLAKTEITELSVLGSALPENSNRETISKVLEKANKERQYGVEQSASRLTSAITNNQDAIKAIEKRIKETREALLKLTVPVVTVEQVVGN